MICNRNDVLMSWLLRCRNRSRRAEGYCEMLVLDRSCNMFSAHTVDVSVDADGLLVRSPPLKTLALTICTLHPISADA